MNRIVLILNLIWIQTFCFGQETILVKNKQGKDYREEYFVLRDNPEIRNGSYHRFFRKNLVEEGFYKNGVQDSIWTEYFFNEKLCTGIYSNGIKAGIWTFFNGDEVVQKYDFSKKELVFTRKLSEKEERDEFIVYNDGDTIKTKLDRPPLFVGGDNYLFYQLWKDFEYPKKAMKNNTTGRVYLGFNIDSSGQTSNFHIIKGIGDGCDEEVIRVSKNFASIWLPGILNGKYVNVTYVQMVKFDISD